MKKLAYLLTVVAGVIALPLSAHAADQADYEKLGDKMVALIGKMVDQVESVTDEATADTAVAAIQKLAKEEVPKISEEMKKLGKPSAEIEEAMNKKLQTQMEGHMTRMMTAMMSLAQKDPAAMQKLQGGMESFFNAMQESDPWEGKEADEAPAEEEKEAA
ncbi:hypothetical protein [Sulfuriroseicoccus oceanibius]|uniref:Uncharacterized protein n=1 Tax=Sulfuriroseicoccus oceanibius TaxID=2707525 RepID=A0A6B3LE84_9BACT|nr:hypothetical protein [Sulfuriroseicoccus oceanibius]QQL45483.1 hypothetical protein G3M56_002525 [Sulfuriroseicoccus oceanibius]